MGRGVIEPERPVKVTDLLIRQKAEAMILWAYTALRQFPKWERHVLAAEMRRTLWSLLRLIVVCNKRYFKKTTLQELDAEIDLLRSGDVLPSDAFGRVGNRRPGQRGIVTLDLKHRLSGVKALANSAHRGVVQFGASVLGAFRVVASMAKGVVDVFLYRAIGQIAQPVVERVAVKMPHNGSALSHPDPAFQQEAVRQNELGLTVLRDAAPAVGRGVAGLHHKLRHRFPVIRSWPGATTGQSRLMNRRTGKNTPVRAGRVAVKNWVCGNLDLLAVNLDKHGFAPVVCYR